MSKARKIAVACVLVSAAAATSYVQIAPSAPDPGASVTPFNIRLAGYHQPIVVDSMVPIRFGLAPFPKETSDKSRYAIAVSVDHEQADTVNLAQCNPGTDSTLSIPWKFRTPSLHAVTVSLLRASDRVALASDVTPVMVTARPAPERRLTMTTHTTRHGTGQQQRTFILTKGIDGKIQIRPARDFDLAGSVRLAVSSRGDEDLVSLSRMNRSVPKATLIDYVSGNEVTIKVLGSNTVYVSTLR